MPRLPLGDLEEALKNPMAYRQKLQHPVSSFYGPSYFGALRDAVFKFHRTNGNVVQARRYLEGRLAQFADIARSNEIMDQFEWYTGEYSQPRVASIRNAASSSRATSSLGATRFILLGRSQPC